MLGGRQLKTLAVVGVLLVALAAGFPPNVGADPTECIPDVTGERRAPECAAPAGTINPKWEHELRGTTLRIKWWPDFHWREQAPGGEVLLTLYVDEWVVARQSGVVNSIDRFWFHHNYYDVPTPLPLGQQTDLDRSFAYYDCPVVNGDLMVVLVMSGYIEYENGARYNIKPMNHPCVDP